MYIRASFQQANRVATTAIMELNCNMVQNNWWWLGQIGHHAGLEEAHLGTVKHSGDLTVSIKMNWNAFGSISILSELNWHTGCR